MENTAGRVDIKNIRNNTLEYMEDYRFDKYIGKVNGINELGILFQNNINIKRV